MLTIEGGAEVGGDIVVLGGGVRRTPAKKGGGPDLRGGQETPRTLLRRRPTIQSKHWGCLASEVDGTLARDSGVGGGSDRKASCPKECQLDKARIGRMAVWQRRSLVSFFNIWVQHRYAPRCPATLTIVRRMVAAQWSQTGPHSQAPRTPRHPSALLAGLHRVWFVKGKCQGKV